MIKIDYKNFEIEIIDDPNYILDSTDNLHQYQKVYLEHKFFHSSKHAVIIKQNGVEISSAIICEDGGETGIYEDSFIIQEDKIWIRTCNKIHCLKIPSLDLIWKKEFDFATNFAVYKIENDFIIYGELEIFRISKEGEIIWRFAGRDIWVSIEDKNPFSIESNKIRLFDFQSNEYALDFDGNLIEDNPKTIKIETKKKWWQIFRQS